MLHEKLFSIAICLFSLRSCVVYHLDKDCAIELVGLVVEDVTVSHLALLATKKSVLVIPARYYPWWQTQVPLKTKTTLIGI